MTTPQNPDGPGGQDPQNPYGSPAEQPPAAPQNPYGAPPPPPEQPAAPADPYAQQPPAAPAYGEQPAQPAYGEQPAQPAYGQQPYGAPPPGQPGQPYPTYGAPPPSNDAPKGMAITALILAFLGCTGILAIVSIILAVLVLLKGKDGRNHGKGLAIAAIIVSIITLAIGAAVVALGVFVGSLAEVDDLSTGDCITADGLSETEADTVTNIKLVECSETHDGEVLETTTLTSEQADTFTTDPSISVCADAITAAGKAALITEAVTFTALTEPDPEAGDKVACIAYNVDGSSLTGTLGG